MKKLSIKNGASDTDFPDSEFVDLLIRGADELRKRLGINESSFNFMSRAHNLRGRNHYVYAVLDEVEQVAMYLEKSQDELGDSPDAAPSDDFGGRLLRNTFATVEREQALHIRRLTEILIDLINFSRANSNVYYDHYLLCKELGEHRKREADFQRYFNCNNLNTQSAIAFTKRSIAEAEKKLQLGNCWYLNPTFQDRFDKALPLASKGERLVLGLYYGQAYREPSQSIHLNIGGLGSSPSWDDLKSRRSQIWLLAANCLNRCRKLLNLRSRNSVIAGLSKALRESMKGGPYVQYTQRSIVKGDFVSVFGSLGEVVASRKSKFGYKCFKVRYLSRPPIHKEDWYPAIFVMKYKDGNKMRDGILRRLGSGGMPARVNPRLVRQAMRKSVLEVWEQLQTASRKKSAWLPS